VLNGRENTAVRAEIGVAHVRAFEDAVEREREATEVFRRGHRGRIL
jgi:hypothetical protein